MIYRVKQVNKDSFIPQCRPWFDFHWSNLDSKDNYIWFNERSYCIHNSLEQAKETIKRYKNYLKIKKQYPKYYKV